MYLLHWCSFLYLCYFIIKSIKIEEGHSQGEKALSSCWETDIVTEDFKGPQRKSISFITWVEWTGEGSDGWKGTAVTEKMKGRMQGLERIGIPLG